MKCCICGKEIDEVHSNNPYPYMTEGRCCNECNEKHVIPARMADIHKYIHSNPQIRPYA